MIAVLAPLLRAAHRRLRLAAGFVFTLLTEARAN
jgi:hypothetical protein